MDDLFTDPFWVIDILPEQVPADKGHRYFPAEQYFLRRPDTRQKKSDLLLKLCCYYDVLAAADTEEVRNPAPEVLEDWIHRRYTCVFIGDSVIASDPEDTSMTVYHPDERLLSRIRTLAAAEGLFVWQPPQEEA